MAKPDDHLGLFLKGNRYWHTDSSFKKVGAKASLLRAVEVPDSGGDTEWADMRAAWDALDTATQQRLEGLVAVHSYAWSQGLVGGIRYLKPTELEALPPVEHPIVRSHPGHRTQESLYRPTRLAYRRHGSGSEAARCCANSPKTPASRPASSATNGVLATWRFGTTAACCTVAILGRSSSVV